ncbi:MAG TPA: hydroxymethylbilane synthase [Planctomycetaceae bacterium]|nr:hydroxymethylbilane synthase [Planctomycetaceae bacterium]
MSSTLPQPLRIATRASRLALWQAEHVAALLRAAAPQVAVELVHVTTTGDRDQTGELKSFGGLGVFTREVQKAVLDGQADIAVHSLKDLPTESAQGLVLAAVPAREDTDDAVVLPPSDKPSADRVLFPMRARVGTGSPRRRAQFWHIRPDLKFLDVRGNIETRLKKLDNGEYDSLLLAVAGLKRLGLAERITYMMRPPEMFPAVGQGALGIECREGDADLRLLLEKIGDPSTYCAVIAERALLARLGAGCHAPVGAIARFQDGVLELQAVVCSPNGRERLVAEARDPAANGIALGQSVADDLLQQGAARLIAMEPL